ncbi:3-oxoacyl-[acyl-carrier-protein] reductase [Burkholderia gladioli]|nr:3-oxoacyl-[acyl-carrier-protein] reductase [Burkholderia gladioli]
MESTASTAAAPRIALVTGAGSGIGRATARRLLADGFTVVAAGRRAEPLAALVEEARADGREALAVTVDVRDAASVDALYATIERTYGRLDLLFNNAGVNAPAVPMDELSVEQWRDVIDTNVTGVFLCARGDFALMRRQTPRGGRIINNGSISAHTPRPFTSPYTASKHAVLGPVSYTHLDVYKRQPLPRPIRPASTRCWA